MTRGLAKHATTLVLVALCLVALVVVFFVDRGSVSTDEAEQRKRNLVDVWRRDELSEVVVIARGKKAVLTRRAVDSGELRWSVAMDGASFDADPAIVDQYLSALELARFDRKVAPEAVDHAALASPKIRVELTMGGLRRRISVAGEAAPRGRYAEVEGRGVFVVTPELASALDVEVERFRSRAFLPYAAADLRALSLDGEGGPRHFERAPWSGGRGAGFRWDGSTPEGAQRAKAAALQQVLAALRAMEAERFLELDAAERALVKRVTLTLVPPEGPPAIVDLGGECPHAEAGAPRTVAIRRTPSVLAACVGQGSFEPLTMTAEAFVDRHVLGAPPDEVTEVVLSRGAETVDLARAGAAWHLRAPDDRQVSAEVGRAFLGALLDVEGTPISGRSDRELGLSEPRGKLRVISAAMPGSSSDRVEEVLVGGEVPGQVPPAIAVRRLEDGVVLAVPAKDAGALAPSDLALRSPTIWSESSRRFRRLRIEARHEGGSLVQHLRRNDEEPWTLVEPRGPGLRADTGLAMELAELLGSLSAERWVAAKDDGSFGLGVPRLVIEAELAPRDDASSDGGASGEKLHLELGARTSGGAFARRSDDGAIFVAPEALEAAASRLLLDRGSVAEDLTEATRLTLRGDSRRLTLEKQRGAWTLPDGDPARGASLHAALQDLYAEGAVSLGKARDHQGLSRPKLILDAVAPGGPFSIAVGTGDTYRGMAVHYVRRSGVEATFVIARSKLAPLLEAVDATK